MQLKSVLKRYSCPNENKQNYRLLFLLKKKKEEKIFNKLARIPSKSNSSFNC